jgi:20S proteasome subunit alpha 4
MIYRLQDARTIRKIVSVDDQTILAFAGLTADARVLIDRIRVEAQSFLLRMEDAPSVDYLARYLAKIQQQYTQQGGVRPFGIATLMAGIGVDIHQPKKPYLYQTDPAGTYSRWKAQVIGGRNAKSLREFLEKHYSSEMTETTAIRLAIKSLLEVVDSGAQTMEICIVQHGGNKVMMTETQIESIVKEIEAEQLEAQQQGTTSTTTQRSSTATTVTAGGDA